LLSVWWSETRKAGLARRQPAVHPAVCLLRRPALPRHHGQGSVRTSTLKEGNAPQAAILYDKFHVLKHLSDALDEVRKRAYARLSGKDRRFIKGQKYTLLAHWENLTTQGRKALKLLFKANKRLHKAYLLKESFGQVWG
jgi:hypothetical protein